MEAHHILAYMFKIRLIMRSKFKLLLGFMVFIISIAKLPQYLTASNCKHHQTIHTSSLASQWCLCPVCPVTAGTRDAGVCDAPEGWSRSWEVAGVRGEVPGVFPQFSLLVQGMKAARRWRHPKTSSCLDASLQDGIWVSLVLFMKKVGVEQASPPPALDSSMGLVLQGGNFFPPSLPHKERGSALKCLSSLGIAPHSFVAAWQELGMWMNRGSLLLSGLEEWHPLTQWTVWGGPCLWES